MTNKGQYGFGGIMVAISLLGVVIIVATVFSTVGIFEQFSEAKEKVRQTGSSCDPDNINFECCFKCEEYGHSSFHYEGRTAFSKQTDCWCYDNEGLGIQMG